MEHLRTRLRQSRRDPQASQSDNCRRNCQRSAQCTWHRSCRDWICTLARPWHSCRLASQQHKCNCTMPILATSVSKFRRARTGPMRTHPHPARSVFHENLQRIGIRTVLLGALPCGSSQSTLPRFDTGQRGIHWHQAHTVNPPTHRHKCIGTPQLQPAANPRLTSLIKTNLTNLMSLPNLTDLTRGMIRRSCMERRRTHQCLSRIDRHAIPGSTCTQSNRTQFRYKRHCFGMGLTRIRQHHRHNYNLSSLESSCTYMMPWQLMSPHTSHYAGTGLKHIRLADTCQQSTRPHTMQV